ncbi:MULTISPECIES: glycosyltransferase [Staphylococcus]|jgi:CDP-glycerol glycerophosphotransferase|uniref:CDP-glycerol glycerophosphotransferase family protein n=1 Tax=Staphylococcus nepalensis TaxID=214473 RepID=A0A380GR44_9STAP|nr:MULTISPECIES: glycosyltransferase [Staphylococcus]VDG68031.1 group 1 glycosyl transferase [Lacrimispora indolis]ATH66052.1 teichoic acid biosynthesis protein [Staphylococcus nepalensis]AWI45443.1 teichoic acid biosynthesis protein [Staphylococcus nepalensis]MBO1206391.1 CDP-glycerol glycerophosphotransferase family protein [Staphylococcus nepalensis]MBO1214448.1 CDP-glycerol glycerophosphotransferase family protein [Staphylococcus nepalensis]
MAGKAKKFVLNQGKRKLKFVLEPLKLQLRSKYTKNIMHYANLYKTIEVDENHILYQVRDGQSMTDSPYAIFKYLMEHQAYQKYIHIWVVASQKMQKAYSKKFNKYKNVKFIVKESDDYLHYLAKCKYLINNATFPTYFTKKPNQVYVNTWHGTPLKSMGLDIKDNLLESQNTIRNFLSSDYIISPNQHTTDIFKKAFKLEELNDDAILEIGYPRIDATLKAQSETVIQKLKKQGLKMTNAPILLCSPTWRGHTVSTPEDNIEEMEEMIEVLNKKTDYQVLLKVHPFIYRKAEGNKKLKKYLVNDTFDTNELLSIVDLLVTDYSSIFFDYLVTNKPIIFYTPDYEDYEENRGFYLPVDSLPGPSVHSIETLVDTVNHQQNILTQYNDNYRAYQQKFANYDDGHVTERVVNKVFNTTQQHKEKQQNRKERLLIYPGGMKPNGITTSMMNLLENVDYDRYDITIYLGFNRNKDVVDNLKSLNENVRVILRKGPLLATTMEYYRNLLVRNRGIKSKIEEKIYPNELYEREFRKVFGNSEFDVVIDFSGYAMFWSELLLASNAKRKLIYLHSDMKMDMERKVNGVRPHYTNLKGVMSLYPYYDKLVSVSEVTKQENIKKIATRKTINKFNASMNTINLDRIYNSINEDNDIFMKNGERVIVREQDKQITSVPFHKNDYKVMTMGRLSPEKGFDNLIKAFSGIVEANPNARLYILGDGPLKHQLNKLIESLNLSEHVFLMGQKRNPFNIMKDCELFVLPSYYEGQSMVLLEALTVGIDILASDIPANQYVLDYGKYGMLSFNDSESLQASIQQFISGETPDYAKFDPELYNKEAVEQFYHLLDD